MKIKTKLIILLGLIFFIHSCTENEFEGPSIENIYGDFDINEPLKIIKKNTRYSNNEVVSFNCEFNKPDQ